MLTRTLLNKVLILAIASITLSSCNQKKIGYVDIFKLVSEFELQKEYSEQAKREIEKQKSMIDSVVFAEQLRDPASSEKLKNELYTTLYRETEKTNKEIESMIWKRLNPYINDYGKEKGYEFIHGANGTGNVLYADKDLDLTEDLIKYVNMRYHDKK